MKSASPALLELLGSGRQYACADLFAITRRNGDTMRYCTADVPIRWDEQMYSCYGLQLYGLRYRIVTGLEADEQTLTISCDRTLMLENQPFLDAVKTGALDGARIRRERAYFEAWTKPGPNGLQPVGTIPLFSGFVSSIDSITRTTADLRVKSDLALLDLSMPRNTWQASCLHTLFDEGCSLRRELYATSGSAGAGSTDFVVNWTGATAAYYWNGTVLFTSGPNSGQRRTVKNSNGSQLILSSPLPYAVAEGDKFTAYPGCDHTMNTCEVRYSNTANYRGFPYIPTAETAL